MNPPPLPPWLRPVATIRLRSLLVSFAILALVLTWIAQSRQAEERERRLRAERSGLKSDAHAEKVRRSLLGDLGVVILQDPTRVELLRVGDPTAGASSPRLPTGKLFGPDFYRRVARLLLPLSNYRYLGAGDMHDPRVGLRLSRGGDSIDLLFSLDGSHPGWPHQQVWFFVYPEHGEVFKIEGAEACFSDSELEALIRELMKL